MKQERIATSDVVKREKECDLVFTFSEVQDVIRLIANKEWPDINYGDNECNLWSMIRRELNMCYY